MSSGGVLWKWSDIFHSKKGGSAYKESHGSQFWEEIEIYLDTAVQHYPPEV